MTLTEDEVWCLLTALDCLSDMPTQALGNDLVKTATELRGKLLEVYEKLESIS